MSLGVRLRPGIAKFRRHVRKQSHAELVTDVLEYMDLQRRLAELLTGVAVALKGKPPRNVAHDWSQLPKIAKRFADHWPAERRRIAKQLRVDLKAAQKAWKQLREKK